MGEPAAHEAGAESALRLAVGEVPEELESGFFGLVTDCVVCDVAAGRDGGGGVGHGAETVDEGFEGGGELGGRDGEGACGLWVSDRDQDASIERKGG